MDPAVLGARLEAIEGRVAGSDAERRAALLCAAQLRRDGRRARVQTLWFRPQRQAPRALFAAVGLAASLVAVGHHVLGAALAGGALAASLLDAAGVRLLAPVLALRATQNVIASPRDALGDRVLLVLAASVDAPRSSLLARMERSRRPWPGPAGTLDLALGALLLCVGARMAGASGTPIGAVQLVPSIVLIVLTGLFADAATASAPRRSPAPGAAAALAVERALAAQPPRHLAVEVLLTGAREAGAAGMAAYVAERRRGVAPEDVVVLELGSRSGPLRFLVSDGEHFGARLHPRLTELAAGLPGARAVRGRGRTGARVARGAAWPAVALEGDPRALAGAALRLIASIDAEIAQVRSAQRR